MASVEIKNRVLKVQEVYWKEFKFFQTEKFKEFNPLQKARLKESLKSLSFFKLKNSKSLIPYKRLA